MNRQNSGRFRSPKQKVFGGAVALIAGASFAASAPAVAQDTPTCDGVAATIIGTPGDDILYGTTERDVIVGLGGNDIIRGGASADRLCGGDGRDRIFGGKGQDRIFGGDGGDKLHGNSGRDIIDGGLGNDLLIGGAGDDIMDGNRGRRDRLRGSIDDDLCLDKQDQTRRSDCEGPGNTNDLGPLGFRTTLDGGQVEIEGRIIGQIGTPWNGFNFTLPNEDRVCHSVLIEVTPTRIDNDITTGVFDVEPFSRFLALTDYGFLSSGFLDCDTSEMGARGWWFDSARVTVGSTEHLVLSFPVPESSSMRALHFRSGNEMVALFDPPQLTSIPDPTPNGDVSVDTVPAGTPFTQTNANGTIQSVGTVTAIGQTARIDGPIETRAGECVTVTGTITTTGNGTFDYRDPTNLPRVGFLIDGEEHTFDRGCALRGGTLLTGETEIWDAFNWEEQNGSEIGFFSTALLPFKTLNDIDAVIIKGNGTEAPAIYDVNTLERRDVN